MSNYFFRIRGLLLNGGVFVKIFKPILYFIYRFILLMYGSSIPLNTKFKGKVFLPHGLYGIFISGDAIIGEDVIIYQQVTIGSNYESGSKYRGAPSIGNNVILGAGSKIVGGIVIGKNVKIGTNCSVNQSIEDNLTVVASKPRIIARAD